jgi:hypothetical protein
VHALRPSADNRLEFIAEKHGAILSIGFHNVSIDILETVRIYPLNKLFLVDLPIMIVIQGVKQVQDITETEINIEGRHAEPEMFLSNVPRVQNVEKSEDFGGRLKG